MRNQAWANFIRDHRKKKELSRRGLAEIARLDPSYVTLIERDGYVPRKDKVIEIAQALGVDVDHCCLVAGYAPDRMPIRSLLSRLDEPFRGEMLIPELKQLLQQVGKLNEERQQQLATLLETALHMMKPVPRKAKEAATEPQASL